jgi:hypothetical protein
MPTIAGICGAKRAFLSRLEIGNGLCFVGVAETFNPGVSIRKLKMEVPNPTAISLSVQLYFILLPAE